MAKRAKKKPANGSRNGVVMKPKRGSATTALSPRRKSAAPSVPTPARHCVKSASTIKNQDAFLKHFAARATITEAARRGDMCLRTVHNWITNDPEFVKKMAAAKEQWVDKIESTAMDIAENRSERMLTWMLQAHRSKVYAPTNRITGELEVTHRMVEQTVEAIDVEVSELESELGVT